MKTLLLLRHAESGLTQAGRTDFERTLNERGREASASLGRLMGERGAEPDTILCSSAMRARQTAALVVEASGLKSAVRYDRRIYEATTDTLVEIVAQIEQSAHVVMLVGHNPYISDLLERLTGERRSMSPAALACISLGIEKWSETGAEAGRLEWFVTPEELL